MIQMIQMNDTNGINGDTFLCLVSKFVESRDKFVLSCIRSMFVSRDKFIFRLFLFSGIVIVSQNQTEDIIAPFISLSECIESNAIENFSEENFLKHTLIFLLVFKSNVINIT